MANNERRRPAAKTILPLAVLWLAACATPESAEGAAEPGPAAPVETRPVAAPARPTSGIGAMIVAEALQQGNVPPALALAVAKVGSNFASSALGAAGATGTMQIPPSLADEFDVDTNDLHDAETNIRMGVACLAALGRRYAGDWQLALSHYRGGPLREIDGAFTAHSFTSRYVRDVLRWQRFYRHDPITGAWLRKMQGLPRFAMANGGRTRTVAARQAHDPADIGGRWRAVGTGHRFR